MIQAKNSGKRKGKIINRIMSLCLTVVLLLPMLGGCSSTTSEEGTVVYYLNTDITQVVTLEYEPASEEKEEQIAEYLDMLCTQPDESGMLRTIPESIEVQSWSMKSFLLTVDFSESYYELSTTQEVLIRAAIVRTLVQVTGVSYVKFTVNGEALVNVLGEQVGSMNADSFVENPGQQINSSIETQLTLYFATEDGTALVKETRTVHYSSNISLEKLVIEQLLEGPKKSGSKATISSETKLITISVADGICYVSFDETLSTSNADINEEVLLYSIVNSLTELSNVDKVQISINGSTDGKLRYVYDLSTLYEADDSYLYVEPATEE